MENLKAASFDFRKDTVDMIMSGNGSGLQPYLDAMNANINTISEAFQ